MLNFGQELTYRNYIPWPVEDLPPGGVFQARVYIGAGGYANNEYLVLEVVRGKPCPRCGDYVDPDEDFTETTRGPVCTDCATKDFFKCHNCGKVELSEYEAEFDLCENCVEYNKECHVCHKQFVIKGKDVCSDQCYWHYDNFVHMEEP